MFDSIRSVPPGVYCEHLSDSRVRSIQGSSQTGSDQSSYHKCLLGLDSGTRVHTERQTSHWHSLKQRQFPTKTFILSFIDKISYNPFK